MSAPGREELRASILRRHPCYCEDACRCTAGHVARDLDALLAAERDRVLVALVGTGVITEQVAEVVRNGLALSEAILRAEARS